MSDREKKLVVLFSLAIFVLVNFFAISWYRGYRASVTKALGKAKQSVVDAGIMDQDRETNQGEMDWLADHYPEPKAGQTVQTELEQFASNQATANTLTIKRRKILPSDESGEFDRAKVEFNVSGSEAALYRWLDRLQMPDQFRAITFMRLSPDAKDDTLIDCTVTVEQWYLPATGEEEAAAEAQVEESQPEPAKTLQLPPSSGKPAILNNP
jgi:hypothetical protein